MRSALETGTPVWRDVKRSNRHAGGLEELIMLVLERESDLQAKPRTVCQWCGSPIPARWMFGNDLQAGFCPDCVGERLPEELHEFWSDLGGRDQAPQQPR